MEGEEREDQWQEREGRKGLVGRTVPLLLPLSPAAIHQGDKEIRKGSKQIGR